MIGTPWGAAISSFFSFALGAFIPLTPFLIHPFAKSALIMVVLVGICFIYCRFSIKYFTPT